MSKLNAEILTRLTTECPFPEVFEDVERPAGSMFDVPRRKIGHVRADYDGWRWWNKPWPCHVELETAEICHEIDRTYEALTAKDALADLDSLWQFCHFHPEALANPKYDDEFNFYLEGETCNFWVRMILRRGDYNMYLHAFQK